MPESQTTTSPSAGKIAASTLAHAILPHLGADRSEVLVGPRHGTDTGIVRIGPDRVMAITTDPFYVLPEVGWERAAWFAVHIVASDLSTSGIPPAYLTVDLNLPPDFKDSDLETLWASVSDACSSLGIAVVTGHTGRYDGCAFPTIGGATAIGISAENQYVTTDMVRPGDVVIVTKGPAIETVGTIGATFPRGMQAALGTEVARAAEELFWQMSVVRDAAIATTVGVRDQGVTAMHDATERGLWNAVVEIAEASGHGIVVHRDLVPVPQVVRAVCDVLEIDPFSCSSEGTLVLTCRPQMAWSVVERLRDAGIAAAAIGEMLPVACGLSVVDAGRGPGPLVAPDFDPFWPAYLRAHERWGPG